MKKELVELNEYSDVELSDFIRRNLPHNSKSGLEHYLMDATYDQLKSDVIVLLERNQTRPA
jgi:hypothetical protein